MRPDDGSDMSRFLAVSNMSLTYIFSVELFVNIFSTFFWEFVRDGMPRRPRFILKGKNLFFRAVSGWNWFDSGFLVPFRPDAFARRH